MAQLWLGKGGDVVDRFHILDFAKTIGQQPLGLLTFQKRYFETMFFRGDEPRGEDKEFRLFNEDISGEPYFPNKTGPLGRLRFDSVRLCVRLVGSYLDYR